ncbi:MAG: phosphatidylglycerophosphatase A [Alphaproteobacteria bacterium]|nr:phosphatidylglycerophosphatase A [Alphaproteobacteria bacterium]
MAALKLARAVAGGFGCGAVPGAPGTAASVAATLLGAALLAISPWVLALAAVVAVSVGIWAIARVGAAGDPSWIVIDEIAGQWIALLYLRDPAPLGLLAGFLLFRLFDIVKPGPVGWADRRSGPVAVMADDVVAGVLAALLLYLLRRAWPGVLD